MGSRFNDSQSLAVGELAGVILGKRRRTKMSPKAPPAISAAMKPRTEGGEIPAKVSLNMRPIAIAGLANAVELVNQ